MIRFACRMGARLAAADLRLDARLRKGHRGEDGFVLLETLVAISLISVIMAAFTTFFVNSVANVNQQRATQAATQLADSAIEQLRSLPPSDLVVGNTHTNPTVNNVLYTVTNSLSTCPVAAGSDAMCGTTPPNASFLLAVVTATWPGAHCLCRYVTSTLLSLDSDPIFNVNAVPPADPALTVADQVSTVGETVALQLAPDAGTGVPAFTWALTSGTLPAGLSMGPTGLISGVPTTVASYPSITVTVTDGFGRTASDPFNWTIVAPPTITMPANQTTTINTAVSVPVTSTCPNAPCRFTIVNAPVGLSINPSTGVISGTPTIPGTVTVTVGITDKDGQPPSSAPSPPSFTWSVVSPAGVCVPTIALANGGFETPVRSPGADTNFLQGGSTPLLWDTTAPDNFVELWRNGGNAQDADGGQPISAEEGSQWAELNANDVGALYQDLTTVPGQVLQWSVYHRARAVNGNTTGRDVMQVQIGSTTSQSPQVPTGQSTPNISDNQVSWIHYTGIYIVPAGQTTTRFQFAAISTSTGDRTIGNFIDNLSLNNNIACLTSPATDQASTVNTTIAPFSISVDRGTGPFRWSDPRSTLPAGLVLSTDGHITGTPTAVGTSAVVLTFKDTTDFEQTVSFKWTVYPKPTITAPANQKHSVGSSVTLPLTASCPNSPCTYTLNNGPSGLTITPAGVVTGTVTGSAQVFNAVTITVTDNAGASAKSTSFTWTVLASPTVTTPAAQTTTVGGAVNLTVASACPYTPCTYALNNGPAGLSISNTGVITGSPTTAGTSSTVTVTVTDASGVTATTANFTWTVVPGPTVTTPPAQTTTVGTAVNLTVASTCTNTPCTFTLANAPAGLSISNTGVITGIPTTTGTSAAVTVTITDNTRVSKTTANFTWTVVNGPTITTPATQTVTAGTSVSLSLAYTCPNAPCAFSLANAPAGLSISNGGSITGSASAVGTSNAVKVTVTDLAGVAASTDSFTINVIAPPSAPTAPAAAAGNMQLTVSWAAPATTNGSPVTSYTATSSPGGATCTPSPATATSCTITGLTNGTTYSVTINATNAAGTGPPSSAVSATPMPTCTSVAVGNSATNAYLTYPFDETSPNSGLAARDVSGNARPGAYTSSGVTYGAPGPCPRDGGRAVTLNGSTGYISSNAAPTNPQVFSVAIWFKTTVAGGKLIGLGNSKTGTSGQYDRHIYMTNTGTLTFGVYPGSAKVITTPLAYNDGNWHQVIATLAASSDPNPGIRLYVDGRIVVSDSTTTSAESVGGPSYWRIGYDNLNGWPSAPSNFSFTGSLAFAATYTYAVTPAQAQAQYNAGI